MDRWWKKCNFSQGRQYKEVPSGEWQVLSSHLSERQERCKVGQVKEQCQDSSDSDHSTLLPESLTLGNPLDRTVSGFGFVNYQ